MMEEWNNGTMIRIAPEHSAIPMFQYSISLAFRFLFP